MSQNGKEWEQIYFLQVSYHEIFWIKIFIVYVKLYLIRSIFTSLKETFSDVSQVRGYWKKNQRQKLNI